MPATPRIQSPVAPRIDADIFQRRLPRSFLIGPAPSPAPSPNPQRLNTHLDADAVAILSPKPKSAFSLTPANFRRALPRLADAAAQLHPRVGSELRELAEIAAQTSFLRAGSLPC